MRFTILLFCLCSSLLACKGNTKKTIIATDTVVAKKDTVAKEKFALLDFVVDEKPCSALISNKYKAAGNRAGYPISLFVTVNTIEHDKDGQPSPAENKRFAVLEDEIVKTMKEIGSVCYVGHTTMPGYRDIIFYIKQKDQQAVNNTLGKIKSANSRLIKSYVFENDPKWEAVSEFYKAMADLH
ncbi:DUF695 domain-containing protein [Pedobacter sp. HMF7647]|uniref:DUF695 domain-containing protein n=1 Tax=Hufsiella arboris TaxID=2695275 RepID=A0A7K1Y7K2_9SPHI|nr:DUF695 domain-containing protein [Hufsiella arboris]MXV50547.1 DUF695 domain-containing protein [Hufsiella arboris]